MRKKDTESSLAVRLVMFEQTSNQQITEELVKYNQWYKQKVIDAYSEVLNDYETNTHTLSIGDCAKCQLAMFMVKKEEWMCTKCPEQVFLVKNKLINTFFAGCKFRKFPAKKSDGIEYYDKIMIIRYHKSVIDLLNNMPNEELMCTFDTFFTKVKQIIKEANDNLR